MRLAPWNINSLRLRLPRLLDWLAASDVDVLCLQETKLEDVAFPRLDLEAAGYRCDVHDPALWEDSVLCSEPERALFRESITLGLADSFRLFEQPSDTFSWWDYRMLSFPKNKGLRIDHVLLSPELAARCTSCRIERNARKGDKPSDHAPVVVDIAQ